MTFDIITLVIENDNLIEIWKYRNFYSKRMYQQMKAMSTVLYLYLGRSLPSNLNFVYRYCSLFISYSQIVRIRL
jgi:hypothetical protein